MRDLITVQRQIQLLGDADLRVVAVIALHKNFRVTPVAVGQSLTPSHHIPAIAQCGNLRCNIRVAQTTVQYKGATQRIVVAVIALHKNVAYVIANNSISPCPGDYIAAIGQGGGFRVFV